MRFDSNINRSMFSDVARAPYGEEYAVSGPPFEPFARLTQSIAGDLFDTQNREYHPTQGRWITPDPAGLAAVDPSNPQTWNRYAYVANNPLSFVDPSGEFLMVCGDPSGDGVDEGYVSNDPLGYPTFNCGDFSWYLPIIDEGGGGGGRGNGGGGGAGSGSPGGPSGPPLGVWQEKDTFGLPPRVVYGPLDLGSLLGLTPGTECDFGVCNPIGNGFQDTIALATPGCLANPEVCVLAGGIALEALQVYLIQQAAHKMVETAAEALDPNFEICYLQWDHERATGFHTCWYQCEPSKRVIKSVQFGRCEGFNDSFF